MPKYLLTNLFLALLTGIPFLACGQDSEILPDQQPARILPLTPQPFDSLCAAAPLFSWTASALPAGNHFQFELYDVQEGQEAAAAVTGHMPVWEDRLRVSMYRPLPGTLPLERGKTYAWRVLSMQAGRIAGLSDPQIFTYGCPQADREVTPRPQPIQAYCRLGSPDAPPVYQLTDQTLAFYFTQRYPNDTLRLHVYDDTGNLLTQKTLQTNPGNNYLRFSISELGLDAGSNTPLSLILTATFQETLALRLERR